MALSGTLGDFGLPDIFQLVGHQQKTGVLLLKDGDVEVRISFVDGNVVKAEQSVREHADRLGSIMVRADAITQDQLDKALALQKRTLRRLGDVLIELGALDRATIKDFARLQTTETIYRLFMWRRGTYEFTAQPVDYDEQSYESIRAENILMEGFRMVDEWPAVRKVIPTPRATFQVLRKLPPPTAGGDDNDDLLDGMADAFGEGDGDKAPGPRKVGDAERRVFDLVTPQRTVQDIIDRSRLGEFETSKALATLVQNRHLRLVMPAFDDTALETQPLTAAAIAARAGPVITRVALYAVVASAVYLVVRVASGEALTRTETGAVVARERGGALVEKAGAVTRIRIEQALAAFRLREGHYPRALAELVTAELIEERALSFPYAAPFSYRTTATGYALAAPLE